VASAFVVNPRVSFTSSSDQKSLQVSAASRRARRIRPPLSTDNLFALVTDLKKSGRFPHYEGGALNPLGATVEETDISGTINGVSEVDDGILFPLKGKVVEEVAPRMRFAPSPTGRYDQSARSQTYWT